MVQVQTILSVYDNSGIKKAKCIKVMKRKVALPSNLIVISVKKVLPHRKVAKGEIYPAVIVAYSRIHKRITGEQIFSKENLAIILKKTELLPLATRILGPVYSDLRFSGFAKVLTLASDIV